DHLGILQSRATRRARGWRVADHVVGIGHLGQVLARCSGLLALLAGSGPTLGTRWRRWLREPLGRRRHRGVARVAFETLAKIGNLCPKCGDLLRLDGYDSLQLGDQLDQLVVGRSVRGGIAGRNSPRYARRSRRWWTRRSGGLNSYQLCKQRGRTPLNRPERRWTIIPGRP